MLQTFQVHRRGPGGGVAQLLQDFGSLSAGRLPERRATSATFLPGGLDEAGGEGNKIQARQQPNNPSHQFLSTSSTCPSSPLPPKLLLIHSEEVVPRVVLGLPSTLRRRQQPAQRRHRGRGTAATAAGGFDALREVLGSGEALGPRGGAEVVDDLFYLF